MKPLWLDRKWYQPKKNVLNPHGSDETGTVKKVISYSKKVLNPHGSDETKLLEYAYKIKSSS